MANQNQHLDSTIDSLGKGLDKAKTGASRSIGSWIDALNDSDTPALGKIADELEKLKELLGQKEIDSAKVKKAMTSLGKHTTTAAKQAEGATAEKIKELGQQLTDAAESL